MNCANHPDRPASVFCQNCGKALCPLCARSYAGHVLCEPCLLLRDPAAATAQNTAPPPGAAAGWAQVPYAGGQPGWAPPPSVGVSASPVIAALLGFIPGVGAMYNGQFIKALLHVVVFIVLIGMTSHFNLAGLLIPAWVFYQVFDAAQTASARRDGRPLPDPFGILDLSHRLGPQGAGQNWAAPPYVAPGSVPGARPPDAPGSSYSTAPGVAGGFAAGSSTAYTPDVASDPATGPCTSGPGYVPPSSAWQSTMPGTAPGQPQAYAQVPANAQGYPVPPRRSEPVGAIVLIVVGLLFLLSTMGWLSVGWIYHGWPILLLLLGIWLLLRRVRATSAVPPGAVPAAPQPVPPAAPSNSLSIAPWRGDEPPASTNDREEGR